MDARHEKTRKSEGLEKARVSFHVDGRGGQTRRPGAAEGRARCSDARVASKAVAKRWSDGEITRPRDREIARGRRSRRGERPKGRAGGRGTRTAARQERGRARDGRERERTREGEGRREALTKRRLRAFVVDGQGQM